METRFPGVATRKIPMAPRPNKLLSGKSEGRLPMSDQPIEIPDEGLGVAPFTGPVFVLCSARSGSTLLRTFLNAHPDLACPAETNFALAALSIHRTYEYESVAAGGSPTGSNPAANKLCEQFAEDILFGYAKAQHKRVACDKSLPSLECADLLLKIFPQAKFLCLYRECTDLIASGLEAQPWGFNAYGFTEYVRMAPDNHVAALASYWADRTTREVEFEDSHKDICLRIRYEDLVKEPLSTLSQVSQFLAVRLPEESLISEETFLQASFEGAGDHKILDTLGVHDDSVGRGWKVPRLQIPRLLAERINQLLARLDYASLDELSTPDLVSDTAGDITDSWTPLGLIAPVDVRARTSVAPADERLMELLKLRCDSLVADPAFGRAFKTAPDQIAVRFSLYGSNREITITWPSFQLLDEWLPDDDTNTATVVTTAEVFMKAITGTLPITVALRSREIAIANAATYEASRAVEKVLRALLRAPATT
jgi:hypothetical protein